MKYPNKERSEAIVKWLVEHPLLSKSALCTLVECDYKDLEKAISGAKAITGKHLDAFEAQLSKYGYKKPE
jgi:hypothetical protein